MGTTTNMLRLLACTGVAASLTLAGCGDAGTDSPTPANTDHDHDHDADGHAHDDHADDEAPAADDSEPMSAEAFAQIIVDALSEGDTQTVFSYVEGVGLPEGWRAMLGPMLTDMQGRDLNDRVGRVGEFSREQLQWPDGDLPDALQQVTHILVVTYEESDGEGNSESGTFTFPLVERDEGWRIVLAGPDA